MPSLLYSLICAATSCVGSLIQRVTGFGYGIFVMMFFPYLLTYGEASALAGMISATTSSITAVSLRKHIAWKNIFAPFLSCTVTSYIAIQFMAGQADNTLKLLLGVMLIALSVYFIFFSNKIRIKPSLFAGILAGALSGVMSGLFAMGGPPMVIYYMSSTEDMKEYLATIQTYFALSNLYTMTVKAFAGFVTGRVLIFYVIAAISAFVGMQIGKRVFNHCKPQLLKKIIYGFMACSGVINIVSTFL